MDVLVRQSMVILWLFVANASKCWSWILALAFHDGAEPDLKGDCLASLKTISGSFETEFYISQAGRQLAIQPRDNLKLSSFPFYILRDRVTDMNATS